MRELTLQVLVATMYQNDYSLLQKMNINSDAIIINQCNKCSHNEFDYNGNRILWIDTLQRGLSKSRNMALSFATADICIIADDDVIYENNYKNNIVHAFENNPKADIISFNFQKINLESSRSYTRVNKDRKAPFYHSYSSVSLCFRRLTIIKNNLHFNELIGAGSQYGAGEESLFLKESREKKCLIYENSQYICKVDFSSSSWFSGYDEKNYFNTGVFLGATYGKFAKIMMFYYVIQSRRISELTVNKVIRAILKGIAEYKNLR